MTVRVQLAVIIVGRGEEYLFVVIMSPVSCIPLRSQDMCFKRDMTATMSKDSFKCARAAAAAGACGIRMPGKRV